MRKGQSVAWLYVLYTYPTIPRNLLHQRSLRISETEKLCIVVGCESSAHHNVWGSTNCNSRAEALMEFLNSTSLEILNQGNEPTVCSGGRLEGIDITPGPLRRLDSIID
jgi:hypothetical protein